MHHWVVRWLPSPADFGVAIIRIGMAGMLLWFGVQQILAPDEWIGFIPDHVLSWSGVGAQTFVLANGAAEITFGLLMFLGVFTRFAAFVMGVHMILIALSLGHMAIAIRDWALAAALVGLVFTGGGAWSLDPRRRA